MEPNFQYYKQIFDEYLNDLRFLAKNESVIVRDFNAIPLDQRFDIGEAIENSENDEISKLGDIRVLVIELYENFIDIYNFILNNRKFDTLTYWDTINIIDKYPNTYHLPAEDI